MKTFYDGVLRRRAELVERSGAQRRQVAAAVADLQRTVATPALVGIGVAVTLLSASPKLRWWVVRAWAAYAFIRRLIDR